MPNGDQYLSSGSSVPVRLAPSNPAAVPVFESQGGGAIPITVVTFEQNPGAMPVRLVSALVGGSMPVRVVSGGTGFSPVIPGATQALLLQSGSFILLQTGDLLLLQS